MILCYPQLSSSKASQMFLSFTLPSLLNTGPVKLFHFNNAINVYHSELCSKFSNYFSLIINYRAQAHCQK